jgi:hypothetical protein
MEHRSEERVESQIRFFVHVAECDTDPSMVGTSVTCIGVDFSAHGLQLKTDNILPVSTSLNITIGIGDPFSMYLLSGEIRWARETNEGSFMGILLEDRENTDYRAWEQRFNKLFKEV